MDTIEQIPEEDSRALKVVRVLWKDLGAIELLKFFCNQLHWSPPLPFVPEVFRRAARENPPDVDSRGDRMSSPPPQTRHSRRGELNECVRVCVEMGQS
jgi:hypothetical protein